MTGGELAKDLSDTIVAASLFGYKLITGWDFVWLELDDKVISIKIKVIRDEVFYVVYLDHAFGKPNYTTIEEVKRAVIDLL